MAVIFPFRAWRPPAELAARVAAPPYDVLTSEEAREMARDNPLSFLHISKAEIELEPPAAAADPRVSDLAARNFARFCTGGTLRQDPRPALYVYEQRTEDHGQTGIAAAFSLDEYEQGRIRKHELTRPDKVEDRIRHINAVNANTGPVFLTYRRREEIDAWVDEVRSTQPDTEFTAQDGVRHSVWVVSEMDQIRLLMVLFQEVPLQYIADGHHRAAAADRVRELRRKNNPLHCGDEAYNLFLAVTFSDDQLRILGYHRIIKDLHGLSLQSLIEQLGEKFEINNTSAPQPDRRGDFGMFLDGHWFRLRVKPEAVKSDDPEQGLDVSILQNHVLTPLLGIDDPRTSPRIDFVGGARGTAELERRCGLDAKLAFALYPTGMDQLLAVADAGRSMPPKSTWFDPKLLSGLIVRTLV